jgi:hypothetical protein
MSHQLVHNFRKQNGVWQRKEVGSKKWKTLHVQHGALTAQQEKQRRRQKTRRGVDGQAATAANKWSWV